MTKCRSAVNELISDSSFVIEIVGENRSIN